jgi:uncharacterized protein YegP (UPF0339 family)
MRTLRKQQWRHFLVKNTTHEVNGDFQLYWSKKNIEKAISAQPIVFWFKIYKNDALKIA